MEAPTFRLAVFSDTHGTCSPMLKAIGEYKPDAVAHLGDHASDADRISERFPGLTVYSVLGNCDHGCTAPLRQTVTIEGTTVFLCHGHEFNVKWGLNSLYFAAREAEANIALYGHTHRKDLDDYGALELINPGTAGVGRDRSWCMISFYPGGVHTVDFHAL